MVQCLSSYVGEYAVNMLFFTFFYEYQSEILTYDQGIHIIVIGMEVSAAKFTNFFVHKDLFHHMTLLISTVTAKKMHTR